MRLAVGRAGTATTCSEGCLNVAGACSGAAAGLFAIEVDDDGGFRAATAAEVDAALRQRELFGAVEYPVQRVGSNDRAGDIDVG